jgi:hypothetical protein
MGQCAMSSQYQAVRSAVKRAIWSAFSDRSTEQVA